MGTDQYLFAKKAKRFVDVGRSRVLNAPDFSRLTRTDMTEAEILARVYFSRGYWTGWDDADSTYDYKWEVVYTSTAEAFVRKFPGDVYFLALDSDAYDIRDEGGYSEWERP